MKKILDALPSLAGLALIFLVLLGLINIRHTQAGFAYELSRVLESALRWMVSDKGIEMGGFEEIKPDGSISTPRENNERIEESL